MSGAWRGVFNRLRRRLAQALLHRMVFGEVSGGRWLPHTRIAPSTCIEHADRLSLADHVYIGPFNFIEASGGITLGEGVQITHHVSIVTHSSHRAQRLLGRAYAAWPSCAQAAAQTGAQTERPGWVAGPVTIGPYCFIGPHSLVEAGSRLGVGCIVRAGSVLRGDYPAHAVIAGNPAVVVGDARQGDARWLAAHPELLAGYAAWASESAEVPAADPPAGLPSSPPAGPPADPPARPPSGPPPGPPETPR